MKKSEIIKKNKRLATILLGTMLLLLIPLGAMQFTDEVVWTLADFVIMGALLLATGITYDVLARKTTKTSQRVVLAGVVLFIFFLIWAELAVGIFGTPFAGN